MKHESGSLLIGVDGGGSACRVAVRMGESGPRYEALRGAANVSAHFDEAVATVKAAMIAALEAAGLPEAALANARAHVGLAGVMNAATAARVARALPVAHIRVTDDRPTSLAGALGAGNGAIAAIGTGSFLGRQAGGVQQLTGGWGFAIGDQASGAWLGRRLVEEIMLAIDGFAGWTELGRSILTEHGNDPSALVAFSITARPRDYAAFAPHIAAATDPLAHRLMQEGAAYITRGVQAMGWRPGEALCLMGGLGPRYAPFLPQDMQAMITEPLGTALDGALALAAQMPERAP